MKFGFILLALFLVTVDQVSKNLVQSLGLQMFINTGVSWGIGQGTESWSLIFIIGICLIYIFQIGYMSNNLVDKILWALVWGGGVGNWVDRIFFGGVRDWINLFSWFPWFNLADVFVSLGVFVLMLKYILKRKVIKHGSDEGS